MNNLTGLIEKYFVPMAGRLSKSKYLKAISNGFSVLLPITMIGAIFTLLANLQIAPYQSLITAEHLVDICEYVTPVFSVIDAIEGMEGDGPSAGKKRHVGLIMASESPYALDVAGAHLIGLKPEQVPTIQAAVKRGLCSQNVEDITVLGCPFESVKIPPFQLPKSFDQDLFGRKVPGFLKQILTDALRAKPVFDYNKCISCGECKRGCPAGIIDMSSGKPKPDLSKCISCFCCHELCPVQAVDIKRHWLNRKLFDRKEEKHEQD